MKKISFIVICAVLLSCVFAPTVCATVDYTPTSVYETYIYDTDGEPIGISAAYETQKVVSTGFSEPTDVCVTDNGTLYICDSKNGRIAITDSHLESFEYIKDFTFENTQHSFSEPKGIWADDNSLYVSDSGNARIVAFEITKQGYICKNIYKRPAITMLEDDYQYVPTKLTVDSTGKMYVISKGINLGVLVLDENGEFMNFVGAPNVEPDLAEILWRKIATKEQLANMESYVPTEYNAITMDDNGFLYVASQTSKKVPVGKLNSDGDNILVEPYDGYGDSVYLENTTYEPYFTDVALYDSGKIGEDIYFVLDSLQGKIYAYAEDGMLLYAFGGNGNQKGLFYSASALEYIPATDGESAKLIVTDSFKNSITVLSETVFSQKILSALSLYNNGKYELAEEAWNEIKDIDSSYLPAEICLAKMLLYKKQYSQALKKLSVIRRYDLYNDAFSKTRDGLIREYFSYGLLLAIVLIAVFIGIRVVIKKKKLGSRLIESDGYKSFKYANYVMLHPFDGFWDLKHERKGNVRTATVIAVLFFVFYALNIQFGGYIATEVNPGEERVIYNVLMLLLPLLFYVVANWCFTTLMDGKGTLKDIYIATCYALKPYVIFALPLLAVSNIVTVEELAFYTFFKTVLVVWVLFLLFAGLMMTHDYTPGKTVITVILVLVGICLIVFLILLVISIVQNISQFAYNTYKEISFRSY